MSPILKLGTMPFLTTPIFRAKFLTFATEVVGSWDEAEKMYFDELSNFVEQTFSSDLYFFEIIEIII